MKVYIIQSEIDNSNYVGMSNNESERLKVHNSGKVKSTKSKRPWKLIYVEECGNLAATRKREKYLKSAAGRRFRKTLGH